MLDLATDRIRKRQAPAWGIRVTEERELFQLRHALAQYPAAVTAIVEAAAGMRRPVDTISVADVEAIGSVTSHEKGCGSEWEASYAHLDSMIRRAILMYVYYGEYT